MSSGVAYYEGEVCNVMRQGRNSPPVLQYPAKNSRTFGIKLDSRKVSNMSCYITINPKPKPKPKPQTLIPFRKLNPALGLGFECLLGGRVFL